MCECVHVDCADASLMPSVTVRSGGLPWLKPAAMVCLCRVVLCLHSGCP